MGRFGSPTLGYHAEADENDIPELNKCPSCGAFFDGDVCPICKTVCPEEMKAGNRAKIKKKKKKEKPVGYKVPPVWYLQTWFILLVLCVSQFIGVILVWLSDWKKWVKVTVTVLALGGGYLVGLLYFPLFQLFQKPPEYVNYDLPESEYREQCDPLDYESLMREPEDYIDRYMVLTLTVESVKYVDGYDMSFTGDVILALDGEGHSYLVYDCRKDGKNILTGDTVTVFGQFGGVDVETAFDYYVRYPIVYGAYLDIG